MSWRFFIKWILLLQTHTGSLLAGAEARTDLGSQRLPTQGGPTVITDTPSYEGWSGAPFRRRPCMHVSFPLPCLIPFVSNFSVCRLSLWSPSPRTPLAPGPLGTLAFLLPSSLCLGQRLCISDCHFVSLLATLFLFLSQGGGVCSLFFLLFSFPQTGLCQWLFHYIFLSLLFNFPFFSLALLVGFCCPQTCSFSLGLYLSVCMSFIM